MTTKQKRHEFYLKHKDHIKKYGLLYYQKNKDKLKKIIKEYKIKNRNKINAKRREYNKTHPYKVNKEVLLKNDLRRRYGISVEKYNKMKEKQNNLCAICGNPESRKSKYGGTCRLHIDHDHATGIVRGLLCNKCNNALGLTCENINILQNMIKYLKNNK